MLRLGRRLLILALIGLVWLPAIGVTAPNILPVDQLRTGMRGIAKTVVSGTKIEQFNVEVLGVMKNKGPAGDLILVRTSGEVMDRTGGIAEGMSGSPVYIGGKLVGAIAYGWSFADHRVSMVTPIADMLKLWDQPATGLHLSGSEGMGENGELRRLDTPLMASGFSTPAFNMLKEKLKPFHLAPYSVGDAPAGIAYGPLEPGSAVGVQFVRGDVNLGAMGTVTYIEGDKVLAFGHPFLQKGAVNYLMTNAYVFTTVQGMESSFKVGTTGDLLGIISQDRGAGVAGRLGLYPGIIPVRIMVKDEDTGAVRDSAVQIIQDEQLAPVLSATTVYDVITKALDRVGPGTAKVNFQITGNNIPGDTISRDNMFYSGSDVGGAAVTEFLQVVNTLAANEYTPVSLTDIKVDINISGERHIASVIGAQVKEASVNPGKPVDLTVQLKPYRGNPVTRTITYTVPADQPAGPMVLEVRGGGMVPLVQLLLKKQGLDEEMLKMKKNQPKTFADVVKELTEQDRNNDIVVEIMNTNPNNQAGAEPGLNQNGLIADHAPLAGTDAAVKKAKPVAGSGTDNKVDTKRGRVALTTDYIIDGDTQVVINVAAEKK